MFGLNREEAVGGWRKLHVDELSNLCCWDDKMK